jgi:hypothetical protein
MAIHGAKSAYPSMQPADAFQKQVAVMLRMLIAGAIAPATTPRAKKSEGKVSKGKVSKGGLSKHKTGGRK